MKQLTTLTIFFALALALALAQANASQSSPISVSGAWSRPAIDTGVVYATIRNAGSRPDRLIGATSPFATHVGMHQTYTTGMSGMQMSGMHMGTMPAGDSMTGMKTLSGIPVPAGGATKLQPGGYHLMLDLRHALKAGESIPLRLHFARAGWIATRVDVRPN